MIAFSYALISTHCYPPTELAENKLQISRKKKSSCVGVCHKFHNHRTQSMHLASDVVILKTIQVAFVPLVSFQICFLVKVSFIFRIYLEYLEILN